MMFYIIKIQLNVFFNVYIEKFVNSNQFHTLQIIFRFLFFNLLNEIILFCYLFYW